MRGNRREEDTWLYKNVSSSFLLLVGVAFSLLIVISDNLFFKFGNFFFLLFLCGYLGKRVRVIRSLLLFLSILFFNLLAPVGEVILRIFTFPITKDALRSGCNKALNILSLMYLSRIVIRDNLNFGSGIGQLIGRMFSFIVSFGEVKGRVNVRNLFESIDSIFLDVYERKEESRASFVSQGTFWGYLVVIGVFLINFGFMRFLG